MVDAYDGSVTLYASDTDDPILKTYAKIFPGIFKPLADMPVELKRHVRYPPGMLAIQARMYLTYHMQDPQVFYNKEDLWAIPTKAVPGGEQEMEPYYTIMKLPGERAEEFILMMPFTPRNKDNMSAWMAARCDAPNYGKVIVYNFPKQKLVYGPSQIEARIDQKTEISKQLSLWNQGGSQVIRGSLLAIPIKNPSLCRIALPGGGKRTVAGTQTSDRGLWQRHRHGAKSRSCPQKLFGGEAEQEQETEATPTIITPGSVQTDRQMAIQALSHYRKSQEFHPGNGPVMGKNSRRWRICDTL